jgi:hypothetical protein
VNVKKTKIMVFNFVDPCQKFVFEGDVIECVHTFKYMGILLETTPNLDSAIEHLTIASRRLLFTLNCCYAELRIMDIKLQYDLFNMLVRSTTNYSCEVWVDSNKIEVIEVVYRRFLKSMLEVQKITNTCIVLVEFGKFPFEHFAWGQVLLYYNRVSMDTKDRILGNAWEAQLAMLVVGKKMLGWIREKMAIQKSTSRGGKFFTSSSTIIGNGASACNDPCVPSKDCSTIVRNNS